MSGHAMIHRRPDAELKVRLANLRLAYAKKWRVEERRTAVAGIVASKAQRPWITEEEAARAGRPRSLMDDNPAAG